MKKIYGLLSAFFVLVMLGFNANAQINLTGTSYSESFDGISMGFPIGWKIKLHSTANALGTDTVLTTTKTRWSSTTRGAFNYASADGLTATSDTATQANSLDRVMGFRQTSTVGDPGVAYTMEIANTINRNSFSMNFKLQSLDASSPRIVTWKLQFGIGAAPTTFTDIVTIPATTTTGGSSWTNTIIAADFGALLDNQSEPVWIRIVTLSTSTGSGNRPTSAIDDVNLTWTNGAATSVATPVFTPVTGTYFGSVNVSIASPTAGATIYYTTDGSTPTIASALYSAPFAITQTSTVNAIAVKTGLTNSTISSATYTINIPVLCANIAELRAKPADNSTIYKLSGEAILTCKIANRNQKYIQDSTAAILIDDPTTPAKITSVYNVGDGITGITGKLYNYFGLLEFIPIQDPGIATSSFNAVNPLIVTAANIQDTTFMKNHQSKLIKIENVSFSDANGVNLFSNGKKYRMTQGTLTDTLFYAYIFSIDYINTYLPSGLGNITGVVNFSKNLNYITARNSADFSFITSPIVTTGSVTSILATTATVAGEVTNDGGSAITERGICWSTSANPSINDSKVIVAGTTGVFSGNLTLLTGSTNYHVRAYATNNVGTSYGSDITFTTAVDTIICTSIADLRSKSANNTTIYKLSSEVILTCKITNRNQKYIQDATAAILIDDPNPAKITTVYNVGDGITGIRGKLENYFGLLEFHPIADPGVATSTSNVVSPLIVTAANIQDTTFMKNHQAKLIKIENVSFTDANGVNKFVNGKKYRMTQNTITDSLFYTYIFSIDYINTFLPSGLGNVTGVVNFTKNLYYITARNAADLSFTALPDTAGVITGSTTVCQGQTNVIYSVPAIANATSYMWTLPAGFTGTSFGNSITLSVSNNAVSGNISVNGLNGNGNGVASTLSITVNQLPAAAGVITGSQLVCEGSLNQLYHISTVQNALNYQWSYQGTGVMINGNDTSAIVNYNMASTSGFLVVKPVNSCGIGDSSKLAITINPIPVTPIITKNGNTLTSNASSGNQWFNTTTGIINNATATTYLPQQNGYYFVIVTLNGCSSDSSNIIHYDNTGINNIENNKTEIYPNPTNGKFSLNINKAEVGDVKIYSMHGSLILSKEVIEGINEFDLSAFGKGIYFVKFTDKKGKSLTEKLIVR